MTTSAPRVGMPDRASISTMAKGVAGRNLASPRTSRPTLTGVRASTSLAASRVSWIVSGEIRSGSGSWTRIPWTVGSTFSRRTTSTSSASVVSAGRS
jgi:hypothetical protein